MKSPRLTHFVRRFRSQVAPFVRDSSLVDWNGDGKPDFVLRTADRLEVWLGNGDATFRLAQTIPSRNGFSFITPVTAVDINRDGKLDLIELGVGKPLTSDQLWPQTTDGG